MAALRPTRGIAERLFMRARLSSPTPAGPQLLSRRSGCVRFYSSDEPPPPPLLLRLKADLKTALRGKDAPRLVAIRGILAAVLNASKTSSPITSDSRLIELIRGTQRASRQAIAEFAAADRQDLVDHEQAQVTVLDDFLHAAGVRIVEDEGEIRAAVDKVINAIGDKPSMNEIMKRVLGAGGPFEDGRVDKQLVAKVVKELVADR
ncbi:GatB/YqeY domain-containing protein [Durotheca rogersii]|uniref:GatB/YqeY domain-containing protein n=1 Tax=Durotheca rogersii TaxID=419775 RepID=UPI00221F7FDD|nr:GatB/YqeY domain-containing protein [Durotheca rogersii]KAI5868635.1 GatB/YqeY domain-containing protein [Durotheca rogersii]